MLREMSSEAASPGTTLGTTLATERLLKEDQTRCEQCNSTFQRVLGLTIKGLLLTAQRVFDVLAVLIHLMYISDTWMDIVKNGHFWLLVFGVLASTFLSALTLSRHRLALRKNRPYGWCLALIVSVLQLAPFVEMVDKLGDGVCWGLREDDTASVLNGPSQRQVQAEMKGSRYGENLMRGLRKLSISSLPLILLSALVHSAWLLEALGSDAVDEIVTEAAGLTVGIICLSMAFADVVLYVWVDDTFVRNHKKLVQVHYFVEIVARIPLLCLLLHVVDSGYIPLLALLACDMSVSVLLLLMPSFQSGRRGGRRSCRHALSQVASAGILSWILFFVNIAMFDPREAFQVINIGFYIVKFIEAFIVCRVFHWNREFGKLETVFQEAELCAVAVNVAMVWLVAWMRKCQDAGMPDVRQDLPRPRRLFLDETTRPPTSRSQLFGLPQNIALELGTVGSPQHRDREPRAESARLELLGDMLEGLCLTSDAESDRNRSAVARSTVADVLWSLVLPWKGVYTETVPADSGDHGGDSERRVVLEMIDPDRGVVVIKRDGSEFVGVIFQGTAIEVVLDPSEGRVIGSNTGKEIRFRNGTVWTRLDSSRSSSPSSSRSIPDRDPESDAREVLRLVLTQVLLSLRWESTILGLPQKMQAADLVAIDATRRPLLSFLVRYAIGTRDETFVSEIYWSLWCLSEDKDDPGHIAYDKARWVLINALDGNIEFWDSVHGVQLDVWASRSSKSQSTTHADKKFRDQALRLITQQVAFWDQTLQLAALGRETAGEAAEKTRAIRHRLHEMKREAANQEGELRLPSDDRYLREVLDVSGASFSQASESGVHVEGPLSPAARPSTCPAPSASLTTSSADFLSIPLDRVDVNRCEILKSNAAPLVLGCLQASSAGRGLDLESGRSLQRMVSESQVDRYMVKVGDDLRQDQLVLQMLHLMELVWQERLPEENEMLRFVNYRVLAMTPAAGYIKFVPGAMSLSKALQESNGDLLTWFNNNPAEDMTRDQVLNNLCGSAAAYCVATYVLGIGDRHLDNLQITPEGHFFHIDFGFIFGEDPKPFAPRLRLPQQVASVLMKTSDSGGISLLDKCFWLAGRGYIALRRSMPLWVSLLRVTGRAGGAGCTRLRQNANAAVVVVTERLRIDLDSHEEEKAASDFLWVLTESTEALYPVLTDKVHQLGLFWK